MEIEDIHFFLWILCPHFCTFKGGVRIFNIWTISPVAIEIVGKLKKKILEKLSENWIKFFSGLKIYSIWVSQTTKPYSILGSPTTKFYSVLVSPTTKFYSIWVSPTTKFYSILVSRQPNFTPFGCPRQLLRTPLKGWVKAWFWQKVSLLKLRNTGAPSTKWGAVHCTLYSVHCTLYTVHCRL